MALRPTGPGEGGQPRIQRPRRAPERTPVVRPETAPVPEPQQKIAPTPGHRLKTALTEKEIEAQIQRLMHLIANDNIDPDAPPGSYLNFLI